MLYRIIASISLSRRFARFHIYMTGGCTGFVDEARSAVVLRSRPEGALFLSDSLSERAHSRQE
jgi:hypothetical protein